jgi:hypothetical protein
MLGGQGGNIIGRIALLPPGSMHRSSSTNPHRHVDHDKKDLFHVSNVWELASTRASNI